MLERYLLRYFLAVVDRGNFSRAAAQCNVAQPTLSVGIAKLERVLGRRLLVRTNQRVELTEAGTRFLPHARRIEREFNLAADAMSNAEPRSHLRLGVLSSLPIAPIARAIAETCPNAYHRFELKFGNDRELASHLARRRIDLAITLVGRGDERFIERPIVEEGYALALSIDHPLAGEREIAAESLSAEVMIVRRHCEALSETSRHFTERGIRPHFALRSTDDARVLDMVAAGLGITVMPACFKASDVVRPLLAGFTARRTLGIAASPNAEPLVEADPPVLAHIVEALRKM